MQFLPALLSSFFFAAGAMVGGAAQAQPASAPSHTSPTLSLLNASDIRQFKSAYLPAGIEWRGVARTLTQAPRWIAADPVVSVISKTDAAPSGDKKDYLSYGIYVWQEPKDIIYRDGDINRANFARDDRLALEKMVRQLRTLSLAYALNGDENVAAAAATRLRAWFLDPATGMNPNLTYAEMKGNKNNTGWTKGWWGYQQGRSLLAALDAARLIEGSPAWRPADTAALQNWFVQYAEWTKTAPSVSQAAAAANNHYSWYVVQQALLAEAVGRPEIARTLVRRYLSEKMLAQVADNGAQTIEMERPDGLTYSLSNLFAMLRVAELADRLQAWPEDDGLSRRRIVAAYEYLRPALRNPSAWPHTQSQKIGWPLRQQAIFTAAAVLNQRQWLADLASLPSEARPCTSGMWLSTGAFKLIPPGQRNACRSIMAGKPAQSAIVSETTSVPEAVSVADTSAAAATSPRHIVPSENPASVSDVVTGAGASNLGRK